MIAFSAWRNKNTRCLMRLLQALCGRSCYIDKLHEVFYISPVSCSRLQDRQRKHGPQRVIVEGELHDTVVTDQFLCLLGTYLGSTVPRNVLRVHRERNSSISSQVMQISHHGSATAFVGKCIWIEWSTLLGNPGAIGTFSQCLGLWSQAPEKFWDGSHWVLQFLKEL